MSTISLTTFPLANSAFASLNEYIYPEDFGAISNGIFDSSFAIQNAINFAATSNVGTVRLAPGVYVANNLTGLSNVILEGNPCADLMINFPSPSAVSSQVTVLRQPAAGGNILTVNGPSGSYVVNFGIKNICFQGNNNASGNGVTSIGLKIGQWARWTTVKNCSALFFGDQGFWFGGIAYNVNSCLAAYNCRTQPRNRISAGAEFYGSDAMVSQCEFNGQQNTETTLTSGLLTKAILIQTADSFYSDIVGEFGDAGYTIVGLVNPIPDPSGFDWGQTCAGNHFVNCRADHNKGNGFEVYGQFGGIPVDNTFVNCWTDADGLDTGTNRIHVDGTTGITSDAGFVITGAQRTTFIGCSATNNAGVTNNLNWGIYESTLLNAELVGCNTIVGFTANNNAYISGKVHAGFPSQLYGTIGDNGDTAIVQRAASNGIMNLADVSWIRMTDGAGVTITGVSGYNKVGQKVRLMSAAGTQTINNSFLAVNWSNGRARRFVTQNQAADIFQNAGFWTEPGPPKKSFFSNTIGIGTLSGLQSFNFSVTAAGANTGDLIHLAYNKTLSGCIAWGHVNSGGFVDCVVFNPNTGTVNVPSSFFNVQAELW